MGMYMDFRYMVVVMVDMCQTGVNLASKQRVAVIVVVRIPNVVRCVVVAVEWEEGAGERSGLICVYIKNNGKMLPNIRIHVPVCQHLLKMYI